VREQVLVPELVLEPELEQEQAPELELGPVPGQVPALARHMRLSNS
jgi:hypothetical protein